MDLVVRGYQVCTISMGDSVALTHRYMDMKPDRFGNVSETCL